MDNNKISNTKKKVPTGIKLNEKDYMNSLLSCLKEMEKNYVVAMTEASNEILFKKINNMFNEIKDMQRVVYENMFKNGWYSLEKQDKTKINEKHNMLNQELMDLDL